MRVTTDGVVTPISASLSIFYFLVKRDVHAQEAGEEPKLPTYTRELLVPTEVASESIAATRQQHDEIASCQDVARESDPRERAAAELFGADIARVFARNQRWWRSCPRCRLPMRPLGLRSQQATDMLLAAASAMWQQVITLLVVGMQPSPDHGRLPLFDVRIEWSELFWTASTIDPIPMSSHSLPTPDT